MPSELYSLNLKLCSKQYNKKFVLHLIVMLQLSSNQRHNYSTKTRQAGCADEQSSVYASITQDQMFSVWAVDAKKTHFDETLWTLAVGSKIFDLTTNIVFLQVLSVIGCLKKTLLKG